MWGRGLSLKNITSYYLLLLLVFLLAGGYIAYAKVSSSSKEVRYVTAPAQKGMITTDISANGNNTVGNSANVNPSISGTVTRLTVKPGDSVKKGQILFIIANDQLDINVSKSYASYLQSQQSLAAAPAQLLQAQLDYDNASQQAGVSAANLQALEQKVIAAQAAVNTASPAQIESAKAQLLQAQADLTKAQQQSQTSAENLAVLAQKIDAAQASVAAAQQNVNTSQADYQNQKAIADQRTVTAPIDGTITALNIQEGSIIGSSNQGSAGASNTASNQGSPGASSASAGGAAGAAGSSGPTAALGSSMSASSTSTTGQSNSAMSQPIPTIQDLGSLKATVQISEVDIPKVALGQKTTLTFDAVEGLTITGKVEKIDTAGTINSGVVTYGATIGFDTIDNRVRTGMSVSAYITTGVKQDVLIVPNSAVKTQGDKHYVEILENGVPRQQTVEVGLSNDTFTEVTSGLKEGDNVVIQTINPDVNPSQTAQPTGGGLGSFSGGRPTGACGFSSGGSVPRAGGG